jgi:hypothetical protein
MVGQSILATVQACSVMFFGTWATIDSAKWLLGILCDYLLQHDAQTNVLVGQMLLIVRNRYQYFTTVLCAWSLTTNACISGIQCNMYI